MAYVPQNVYVFVSAYAGAVAAIAGSLKVPYDPNTSSYAGFTNVAGAFAQSFDTEWGLTATNSLDVETIQSVCEAVFEGRTPIPVPPFTETTNWTELSRAIVALLLANDDYFSNQGIVPPPIGGGAPPIGPAGGNLYGTYPNPSVGKVNDVDYEVGGALVIGQVPRVDGASSTSYGPLDLGNPDAVTGTLPTGNQADQALVGDVTGDTGANVVEKVNGTSYQSGGGLTIGQVPVVDGLSSTSYGPIDLGNSNAITGLLPNTNQDAQDLLGDVTGTTASSVVERVNGASYPPAGALVIGTIPRVEGPALVGYGALNLSNPSAVTGTLPTARQANQTLAGDVTGNTGASVVEKVNGTSYQSGGGLTIGQVAVVDGVSSTSYGPIDLGNVNAVTGTLPTTRQANQALVGDVTGNTGANVVQKVNGTSYPVGGALVTGTIPRVEGPALVGYGALNLSNPSAVTGTLPTANQANQTMAGDVTGTTAASVVEKINGATVPAAGALTPSHLIMVSGANALAYGFLTNGNVDVNAAIAGTKVSPNFGTQNILTTGDVSAGGATVASSGTFRGPIAVVVLSVRNQANTQNLGLVQTTSANIGIFGDSTNCPTTQLRAATTLSFVTGSIARMTMTSAGMTFDEATATMTMTQTPRASNNPCSNAIFTSQAPNGSASGANRSPGNFVWRVPAAVAGGTEGKHEFDVAGTSHAEISGTIADTQTSLWLRRNVGGVFSLQQVTMGAADSGGVGFKVLRVPN